MRYQLPVVMFDVVLIYLYNLREDVHVLLQESPVVRPLAIGHHGFGSDARCSSNHASEIFKLKNIINAQLTSIAEQRLTIDSQSNSLREFKEENEMVRVSLSMTIAPYIMNRPMEDDRLI